MGIKWIFGLHRTSPQLHLNKQMVLVSNFYRVFWGFFVDLHEHISCERTSFSH